MRTSGASHCPSQITIDQNPGCEPAFPTLLHSPLMLSDMFQLEHTSESSVADPSSSITLEEYSE